MDYEKMWNQLKYNVISDVDSLSNENTTVAYGDILRMATAKMVLQSILEIEKEQS